MIIYLVYAIILSVHRRSVISTPKEISNTYKGDENNEGVVNPDMDQGYGGDDAEL